MRNLYLVIPFVLLFSATFGKISAAEPIYHEKLYPEGSEKQPAVIVLHTSGGFKTIKHLTKRYVDAGFIVYAPDFFQRHGITSSNRMETFNEYRQSIENELSELVEVIKKDPKVDDRNIFAVGYSNGGFWACFLAGSSKVNAGVSHYGVWKANFGGEITNDYPMGYFSSSSSPTLALHGGRDLTQKIEFAEEAWKEIRSQGADLTTHIFPRANHGWDKKNSWKFRYNQAVDLESHKLTILFFKQHIRN